MFIVAGIPTPENLPSKAKKMLTPGGQPERGEGTGCSWNCWLMHYHQMTHVTRKTQSAGTCLYHPQPADLLFSNLIGSTLHVDNKTNEQSAFKITSIWVQNIWTLAESAGIGTDPTELHFSLFYWFKRCTWRRELLCQKLVTNRFGDRV